MLLCDLIELVIAIAQAFTVLYCVNLPERR